MSRRGKLSGLLLAGLLLAACVSIEPPTVDSGAKTADDGIDAGRVPKDFARYGENAPPDLSGTWISEITSDHFWFFLPKYRNLVIDITQQGDRIVASEGAYDTHVTGTLNGDTIRFEVAPGLLSGHYDADGEWRIRDNGNRLEGRWRALDHQADGVWNLTRIGHSGVQLFTLEDGRDNPHKISDSDILFERLFNGDDARNVVFFIHGRGQDLDKNFDAWAIPDVEAYSNTRFVIVHWQSWNGLTGRPYRQAIKSASGISDLLRALADYRQRNSEQFDQRKVTLLAHSMGNIPLRIFIEKFHRPDTFPRDLFDTMVLSSADLPIENHHQWVEQIDFAEDIYVVQHRNDPVLYLSRLFFEDHPEWQGPKLGAGFDNGEDTRLPDLARNARYLDLTQTTLAAHRHFNMAGPLMSSSVARLYTQLLNGADIDYPDPEIGLFRKSSFNPIYYFYDQDPSLGSNFAGTVTGNRR